MAHILSGASLECFILKKKTSQSPEVDSRNSVSARQPTSFRYPPSLEIANGAPPLRTDEAMDSRPVPREDIPLRL